ncbi:MAG: hypothetical protein JNL65_00950 [Saprospiraceae bacterium]|nr:hypothetical protein [Saprospiraceae bacterium]HRG69188.1 hypothetical protein [Saprospiraceae bacterium]
MSKSFVFNFLSGESLKNYFVYLILFGLSLVMYRQSIGFGYVLDDVIVLSENSFVQKGFKGIKDILSKESFTGYFGTQKDLVAGSRYRPLSIVSFAIEHEFFGNYPAASHFINILLYALTACLIFKLFQKFKIQTENRPWYLTLPFIAALLFTAHPIHSEAVANIKGRDEILCLLFAVATLNSWIRYFDTQSKWHAIASMLWFCLALFSKENAVTFVLIIPLTIYFFRSVPFKSSLIKAWPLYLCFVFFILVRWKVIGYFLSNGQVITDLMNNPFVGMRVDEKMATIFYTILWYFKLLIFPHPLTHDYYPYHVPKVGFTHLVPILSVLICVLLVWLAFRFRSANKTISYSIAYYFISFSIVSNFIFPVGTFMNERFLFMPSLAFSLVSAYAINYLIELPKFKYPAIVFCLLVLVAYAYRTISRVPDWKDGFTLNLSAVNVSKNSARINLFTGVSYYQKAQPEDNEAKKMEYLKIAEMYIDRSLAIFPEYGQGLNMKAGILAEYLKKDNDIMSFLKKLEPVIKAKPDLDFVTKYMEFLTKDPENNGIMLPYLKHVGYDLLYKEKRNYQFALHFLGMAYKINDHDPEICYYIGLCYQEMARFGKGSSAKIQEFENNAKAFFDQAASLDPKYAK